jgi:hypothetical protein
MGLGKTLQIITLIASEGRNGPPSIGVAPTSLLYKWENENLLAALFSVPRPFVDEWHITYDTTTYPWTLNIVRAESDINCELRRRKNMQGITKSEDAANLVTRLYMLGYGEGDNQLDITRVNNMLPYIDADTIQQWGVKESIWTDRRFEDAANMLATGKKMLEYLKNPYISYEVESIDLFKKTGQEFDEFREGKMVRVIDKADNIDIDTRIMEVDKPDIAKADVKVTIANKDRNIAGSIASLQERSRIHETYAQGSETPNTDTIVKNAEPNFPLRHRFFIPAGVVNIQEARLRVDLDNFRANSRAVQGGGGRTETTTVQAQRAYTTESGGVTTSGPSSLNTTNDGGATTSGASSTTTTQSNPASTSGSSSLNTTESGGQTITQNSVVLVLQNTNVNPVHTHPTTNHDHVIPAHSHGMAHTHSVPGHSHGMAHTHTIQAHTHRFTIPAHYHNITLPDHTHAIEFGIFQGTRADSISIKVDGNAVPTTSNLNNIDIIPFLRRDGGGRISRNAWHTLEIIPNRMTEITASIFLNVFTNSRGGANL